MTKVINFNGNRAIVILKEYSFRIFQLGFTLTVTPAHLDIYDTMDGRSFSFVVPTEFEEEGDVPAWTYSLAGVLEDTCYKRGMRRDWFDELMK